VVINVAIGLLQEGKAEKAADAIKAMLSANATVIRGGKRFTIEADQLVPGDSQERVTYSSDILRSQPCLNLRPTTFEFLITSPLCLCNLALKSLRHMNSSLR
jgi:hypothetical protein